MLGSDNSGRPGMGHHLDGDDDEGDEYTDRFDDSQLTFHRDLTRGLTFEDDSQEEQGYVATILPFGHLYHV